MLLSPLAPAVSLVEGLRVFGSKKIDLEITEKVSVVAHCALTAALRLHVQVILGRQDGNRPAPKKSAYAVMWR